MIMEDEMIGKVETYNTHVDTGGRGWALPVGMYADEHSETCSIRFGNSFTLNVVSPQDLIELAQEIETFARRAYELHYGDSDVLRWVRYDDPAVDVGVEPVDDDTENPPAAACWKDPNDPINW
tara:strand:+ start:53 stop:421 length:369 start_codon:yes stop_codon:yes gene_type:complete